MDEAMLSAATEKAIVTKMTPPELATHLKLNPDRYSAYAQMKWQVVNYVTLKLPNHPQEDDDMNINHFGKTTSGKGKGEAKGKSKTVDAEPDKEGFKGKCCWCNETGHRASE